MCNTLSIIRQRVAVTAWTIIKVRSFKCQLQHVVMIILICTKIHVIVNLLLIHHLVNELIKLLVVHDKKTKEGLRGGSADENTFSLPLVMVVSGLPSTYQVYMIWSPRPSACDTYRPVHTIPLSHRNFSRYSLSPSYASNSCGASSNCGASTPL